MKSFFRITLCTLTLIAGVAIVGCGPQTPTSDEDTAHKQERMLQQAVAQTGMPGITNFTELKMMRHLYELRDQSIATYTYGPDMNGKLWHLCDSVGFGLPYATQFSNPEKNVWLDNGGNRWINTNLPQAEPNGLFMPAAAEGTWIMCGSKSGTQPVYIEPRVIVSTIKLRSAGEYAETSPN